MKKKILTITTLFLICTTLCACSIGKKNPASTEDPQVNTKIENRTGKGKEKENVRGNNILEEDSKDVEDSKENRLVLPEVEVEGYENTKSGD